MTYPNNSIIIKSFTNQLNKCSDLTQFPPITAFQVGDQAHITLWTDTRPYTVIERKGQAHQITEEAKATLTLYLKPILQSADLYAAKTTGSKDGLSQKIPEGTLQGYLG